MVKKAKLPQSVAAQRQFERGLGFHSHANLPKAIDAYEAAIRIDPNHSEARYALAAALAATGRNGEADAVWKRALSAQHGPVGNIVATAEMLLDANQPRAALVLLSTACRSNPDDPRLMALNGRSMAAVGQNGPAIGALFMALDRLPDDPAIHAALANALRAIGDLDLAVHHCHRAFQLAPARAYPGITIDYLIRAGAYDRALALLDDVLRRRPNFLDALRDYAMVLRRLGRFAEGLIAGQRAVSVAPDDVKARHNLAIARLALGLLTPETWELFEWRLRQPGYLPAWLAAAPRWYGEDMAGQTLLLHAEQGLGDTIQFVRYAPLVAGRAERIVLAVQPPLMRLMRHMPGVDQVVATNEPMPRFDRIWFLLSLPRIFDTNLNTIPPAIPYADEFARWDERVAGCGLRVGLAWAGNVGFGDDRQRSLAPSDLAPLVGIGGVQLYSLQMHESGPANLLRECGMIDLIVGIADFADTAARVAGLDLVITVDTAVAHLAATLGRPVWLLSRHTGCWRWLYDRADSPWYPSLRVMRQTRPNDWSELIARVRQDLTVLASERKGLGLNDPASDRSSDRANFMFDVQPGTN